MVDDAHLGLMLSVIGVSAEEQPCLNASHSMQSL
jgi:hypothetical protein